jgi:hypothetical protein
MQDFLSVTSNLVEEFTLILCVTPEGLGASGGETIIYPYASKKGTAYDTTTPGNGLLFRKDLEHAGKFNVHSSSSPFLHEAFIRYSFPPSKSLQVVCSNQDTSTY